MYLTVAHQVPLGAHNKTLPPETTPWHLACRGRLALRGGTSSSWHAQERLQQEHCCCPSPCNNCVLLCPVVNAAEDLRLFLSAEGSNLRKGHTAACPDPVLASPLVPHSQPWGTFGKRSVAKWAPALPDTPPSQLPQCMPAAGRSREPEQQTLARTPTASLPQKCARSEPAERHVAGLALNLTLTRNNPEAKNSSFARFLADSAVHTRAAKLLTWQGLKC